MLAYLYLLTTFNCVHHTTTNIKTLPSSTYTPSAEGNIHGSHGKVYVLVSPKRNEDGSLAEEPHDPLMDDFDEDADPFGQQMSPGDSWRDAARAAEKEVATRTWSNPGQSSGGRPQRGKCFFCIKLKPRQKPILHSKKTAL
jgi:hypothetical protein